MPGESKHGSNSNSIFGLGSVPEESSRKSDPRRRSRIRQTAVSALFAFEAVAGPAQAFANFGDVLEAVRLEHEFDQRFAQFCA